MLAREYINKIKNNKTDLTNVTVDFSSDSSMKDKQEIPFEEFLAALALSSSLEKISLVNLKITNDELIRLAQVIAKLPKLTSCHISYIDKRPLKLINLAPALRCPTLVNLSLSGEYIINTDFIEDATMHLKNLHLAGTISVDEDNKAPEKMMVKNPKLKELSLEGMVISSEFAALLIGLLNLGFSTLHAVKLIACDFANYDDFGNLLLLGGQAHVAIVSSYKQETPVLPTKLEVIATTNDKSLVIDVDQDKRFCLTTSKNSLELGKKDEEILSIVKNTAKFMSENKIPIKELIEFIVNRLSEKLTYLNKQKRNSDKLTLQIKTTKYDKFFANVFLNLAENDPKKSCVTIKCNNDVYSKIEKLNSKNYLIDLMPLTNMENALLCAEQHFKNIYNEEKIITIADFEKFINHLFKAEFHLLQAFPYGIDSANYIDLAFQAILSYKKLPLPQYEGVIMRDLIALFSKDEETYCKSIYELFDWHIIKDKLETAVVANNQHVLFSVKNSSNQVAPKETDSLLAEQRKSSCCSII